MKSAKTALCALALLLIGSPLLADDSPPKVSLKGINEVKLQISVANDLVEAGVRGATLRQQLELQLRKAGLRVEKESEGPVLYVEITGVRGPGTNNFACFVMVSLLEPAKIRRNEVDVTAGIWGPQLYVLYLVRDMEQELFTNAQNRIDEFLNDWLRVNPK